MFQDVFSFPTPETADVQIFRAAGANWQTWNRPRGKSMCHMFAIGAGGGGGAGLTGASASARGGGGGGSAAPASMLIIPIFCLPDYLYIQVPLGGAGGASSGNAGAVGNQSYISVDPTSASLVFLASGVVASTNAGGAAGTSAGNNSGGSASSSPSQQALAKIGGIWVGFGGISGSNSGAITGAAGAAGVASSLLGGNNFTCPGAGGGTVGTGNANFAGGAITGLGRYQTLAGGLAAGGNGQSGFQFLRPLLGYGGSGGGTNGASGTGGFGGDGGFGCGGGGGGGAVTGGAGGRGGDGLVGIISW